MGIRAIIILFVYCFGAIKTLGNTKTGVLFFIVITYIRPERLSYDQLAPLRLFMVLSLIILFSYLLNFNKIKKIRNHSKVIYCLLYLALIQIFITPFAVYDAGLSLEWALTYAKIAIFCFLIFKLIISENDIRWFLLANIIGVSFIGVWGFQQHFLGNPRLEDVAGGQFNESNALGTLCAHFVPIMLSLFFMFKDWRFKFLSLALTLILFADVIFTQSRSSLLGVLVGVFIFIIFLPNRHKIVFLLVGLLLIPLVKVALNTTEGYLERIEVTTSGEDKGADRFAIWQAGWLMIQEHPITGVGVHNFRYLAKDYVERLGLEHGFNRLADAHNNVLLIFAETGVVGGMLLLMAYFFHYLDLRHLKKQWRDSKEHSQYIIFLNGLQCGMIAFYISSLFHSYPYGEPFYWFLLVPGLMRNVYEVNKKYDC